MEYEVVWELRPVGLEAFEVSPLCPVRVHVTARGVEAARAKGERWFASMLQSKDPVFRPLLVDGSGEFSGKWCQSWRPEVSAHPQPCKCRS